MNKTYSTTSQDYRVSVFPHPEGIHKGCEFMFEIQRNYGDNWMRVSGGIAETHAQAVAEAQESIDFWIANKTHAN
jgi:hypothetical protein